jgi:hypothetical protein
MVFCGGQVPGHYCRARSHCDAIEKIAARDFAAHPKFSIL